MTFQFDTDDPVAQELVVEALEIMDANNGVLPVDVHARLTNAGLIVDEVIDFP